MILLTGIQTLVQLFKELDSTIETLLVKIDDISTKLHEVKRNLTTAVDECRKKFKGAIADKCDAIPSGDGLKTEANFRKVCYEYSPPALYINTVIVLAYWHC